MVHINMDSFNKLINESRGDRKWEDFDTIVCPDGTTIDMVKLLDDQARARTALNHLMPSLGGLLSQLQFVYTFRVKTQATDGYNIYVNPQFTNELDLTGKTFVMAHEVLHCLLNHLRRGKGHDPYKSNIAADYEVNSTLVELGLFKDSTILKIGALYDEKYKDLGYETIYSMNPSNSNNGSMSNSGQGQSGNGSSSAGSQQKNPNESKTANDAQQAANDAQKAADNAQQNANQNPSDKNAQKAANDAQKAADKAQQAADKAQQAADKGDSKNEAKYAKEAQQSANEAQQAASSTDQNGGGQASSSDCSGPSGLDNVPSNAGGMINRAEGKKIAQDEGYDDNGGSDNSIAEEWTQIAKKVASQGNTPGNLKSKLDGLYKTSHDWKKELRKIVGRSISPEEKRQAYAHKNTLVAQNRVSRTEKDKYDSTDYMMAWIDSSGSMTDDMLKMVLSELYAVALAKKPLKLYVIQCDTKIQDIKEYSNIKDLKKDLKQATVIGRGGTELKPCWDLLRDDKRFNRVKPDLVMIFTDGGLNQYKRDVRKMHNLCWVIIDNLRFDLQYKDKNTMCVHLSSEDLKK